MSHGLFYIIESLRTSKGQSIVAKWHPTVRKEKHSLAAIYPDCIYFIDNIVAVDFMADKI